MHTKTKCSNLLLTNYFVSLPARVVYSLREINGHGLTQCVYLRVVHTGKTNRVVCLNDVARSLSVALIIKPSFISKLHASVNLFSRLRSLMGDITLNIVRFQK